MGNDNFDIVDSSIFSTRMADKWENELKLSKPSEALQDAWRIMADTFNAHIKQDFKNRWSLLPIPTGGGKTVGLSLYCAMLSKVDKHPGVLIVTRLIEDAKPLAESINKIASAEIAFPYNTEDSQSKETLYHAEVLIVTHAAFKNIQEAKAANREYASKWKKMMHWQNGERQLVVIDESLDIVEPIGTTLEDLKLLRALIPHKAEDKLIYYTDIIDRFINELGNFADFGKEKFLEEKYFLSAVDDYEVPNFSDVLKAIDGNRPDSFILGKKDAELKAKLHQRFNDSFKALQRFYYNWSRYYTIGDTHHLSSAYVVLPTELNNAVLLDATAGKNFLYFLMGTVPESVQLPQKIRQYDNVILNVHWGYKVGKLALAGQPKKHFEEIQQLLTQYIPKSSQVLICTHKAVEDKFINGSHGYKEYSIAHWGAITGKNDWQHYDTVVIYGIPSLDPFTPKNTVEAFKRWHEASGGETFLPETTYEQIGYETVVTIDETSLDDFNDLNTDFQHGHTLTSLVQAINRIRCRRAVDGEGRCEPASIYLFLNKGESQRKLIEGIQELMPGIRVNEIITPEKVEPLKGAALEVVNYLQKQKDGIYDPEVIRIELGISERHMQRLLGGNDKRFTSALVETGVQYEAKRGNGGYKRFIKGKVAVMEIT